MRRYDKYIQRGKPPCTAIRKTLELAIYKRERGGNTSTLNKTREQSEARMQHGHAIYIREEWHTPCALCGREEWHIPCTL